MEQITGDMMQEWMDSLYTQLHEPTECWLAEVEGGIGGAVTDEQLEQWAKSGRMAVFASADVETAAADILSRLRAKETHYALCVDNKHDTTHSGIMLARWRNLRQMVTEELGALGTSGKVAFRLKYSAMIGAEEVEQIISSALAAKTKDVARLYVTYKLAFYGISQTEFADDFVSIDPVLAGKMNRESIRKQIQQIQ